MAGHKPDLEEQLRRAILQSGMSRYEVSKQTGIDQGTLSRFVSEDPRKHRTITLTTASRLAEALGLKLAPESSRKRRK